MCLTTVVTKVFLPSILSICATHRTTSCSNKSDAHTAEMFKYRQTANTPLSLSFPGLSLVFFFTLLLLTGVAVILLLLIFRAALTFQLSFLLSLKIIVPSLCSFCSKWEQLTKDGHQTLNSPYMSVLCVSAIFGQVALTQVS